MSLLQRFLQDEKGATAIEYGMIAALIALAIVVGVGAVGQQVTQLWNGNDSEIRKAFSK
ncbi:Flp family type IVb pilin [Mesorhizobium sp. BE184]|uniref:Flp family type IVb pilin n=1 Tax=Mesorhizobium sp. BE184 TaxID=2817714 RepID=UPI002857F3BF|nr:Flp family type IVb pilin [Mesorhizobium sp. BE184]MDR7034351.1 pilus assembly protein Flp/PilA [Mesorhizobium sp. BE184]